ncbi:MAG: serine/threonine protein kinase [Myxococcales bacterium]|nr:serine/threonine protein kinase [Myxococcales bacterium]
MPTEAFQSIQFGNYVLVSQIGKGGMAEVYKAKSGGVQGFQKTVCVKRILRQHTDDAHFVEMFVNEAKISARLSHPNIVQVHELGEVDGEFFMAMEFVHGRDLLRVMRALGADGGTAPPPAVAAYIAREMCRALAHAHDHVGDDGARSPIIHRDVSPQNVMISYDGNVKLVDFGIAKAAQHAGMEETRTGALKGKFAYMAPEQLDGTKASPQSDVFAVGVTLFEMLTARRLFKGTTDYDTLVRVKTQPVPPPSEMNPKIAPELDRIVATALQRDPLKRYLRAAQMARDLELFCGQVGFTAEDMKDFMTHLFPDREEVPDGIIAAPTPISNTGAGNASAKRRIERSIGGTSVTPSRLKAVPPKAPSRTGLFAALAAVVVLAGGGVAVYKLGAGTVPTSPAPPLAVAPPIAAPKQPVAAPAEVETVQLVSNPIGAEVTEGPRLLGVTPVTLKLSEARQTITVRLNRSGYDELTYTVSSTDVPSVILKLNRKRGSGDRKTPGAPEGSPTAPKVKSFDDVEQPHVKTIEE